MMFIFTGAHAQKMYTYESVEGDPLGVVVGNRPTRAFANITSFHDAATWLCQMVMFIVLGLLVTPTTLIDYAVPGIAGSAGATLTRTTGPA